MLMSLTPECLLWQAKQQEQEEFERRAERIRKLEARQKQEEEAAVKALGQQLLAHQVSPPLFHCTLDI